MVKSVLALALVLGCTCDAPSERRLRLSEKNNHPYYAATTSVENPTPMSITYHIASYSPPQCQRGDVEKVEKAENRIVDNPTTLPSLFEEIDRNMKKRPRRTVEMIKEERRREYEEEEERLRREYEEMLEEVRLLQRRESVVIHHHERRRRIEERRREYDEIRRRRRMYATMTFQERLAISRNASHFGPPSRGPPPSHTGALNMEMSKLNMSVAAGDAERLGNIEAYGRSQVKAPVELFDAISIVEH